MSHSMQLWILEKVNSFRESEHLSFSQVLSADVVRSAPVAEGVNFKKRSFTPFVMICLFLSQVIDSDHSCREAVARLIVWLAINRCEPSASETNSYCDVLGQGSIGIFQPRFVRGPLGQHEGRFFTEQREASLGCRGAAMSAPARRHEAGETPARMAVSCYVLQQHFRPRTCGAGPVLPPWNLNRTTARVHLGGHQRVTSFLGDQRPMGTDGVVANVKLP
jgi:hypothetical protein